MNTVETKRTKTKNVIGKYKIEVCLVNEPSSKAINKMNRKINELIRRKFT